MHRSLRQPGLFRVGDDTTGQFDCACLSLTLKLMPLAFALQDRVAGVSRRHGLPGQTPLCASGVPGTSVTLAARFYFDTGRLSTTNNTMCFFPFNPSVAYFE